jgi:hypothetical protein
VNINFPPLRGAVLDGSHIRIQFIAYRLFGEVPRFNTTRDVLSVAKRFAIIMGPQSFHRDGSLL